MTKNYPVIYHNGHVLVVDEQSRYLKEREWIFRGCYPPTGSFRQEILQYKTSMQSTTEKRIIAASPEAKLEGVPFIDVKQGMGYVEKLYTEEDMKIAIRAGFDMSHDHHFESQRDRYIASLQKPIKSVDLEMDYEYKGVPDQQQWQEMGRSEKMEYAIPTTPKLIDNHIIISKIHYA